MSRIIPDDDISDELVDLIIRHVSEPFWTDAIQMAREIQRRRAADLSPEERHALAEFREQFGGTHYPDIVATALRTIDRILGGS